MGNPIIIINYFNDKVNVIQRGSGILLDILRFFLLVQCFFNLQYIIIIHIVIFELSFRRSKLDDFILLRCLDYEDMQNSN